MNWPGNPYIEVIKQISLFCEQYENIIIESKPIPLNALLKNDFQPIFSELDVVFSNNRLVTNSLKNIGFGNLPNHSTTLYRTIKFCYFDTRYVHINGSNEPWEYYTKSLEDMILQENKLGWYFYMEDPLMVFFHFFLDCFITKKEDLTEEIFIEALNRFYSMFSPPGLYSNLYYRQYTDQIFELENQSAMGTVSNYELYKLLNNSNEFVRNKQIMEQPQLDQCSRSTLTNYEKLLFNDLNTDKTEILQEFISILNNKQLNDLIISKVGVVPSSNLANYSDIMEKTFHLSTEMVNRLIAGVEEEVEQYSCLLNHFDFRGAVSLSSELRESIMKFLYKQSLDKQQALLMWDGFERRIQVNMK